jgi:hypothetical protein
MEHPQRQYPTRVAQHTRGKIHGEIIYTGHSFLGQTGFRTVLNRKEEILGIMKNKTIVFFR